MRCVAVPTPGRTVPSARAACFQRSHDGCADGDHPAAAAFAASIAAAVEGGMSYGSSSGSSRIEFGVARRGDARGVCEAGERRAACAERSDRRPIEDEPRRRCLECHRQTRESRPRVPNRERVRRHRRTGSDGRGGPDLPISPRRESRSGSRSGADARAPPTTVAGKGPSLSASPGCRTGGADRCSVGVRKSPAPKTTAVKRVTSLGRSESRPASRTSTTPLSAGARRRGSPASSPRRWPRRRRLRGRAPGNLRAHGE